MNLKEWFDNLDRKVFEWEDRVNRNVNIPFSNAWLKEHPATVGFFSQMGGRTFGQNVYETPERSPYYRELPPEQKKAYKTGAKINAGATVVAEILLAAGLAKAKVGRERELIPQKPKLNPSNNWEDICSEIAGKLKWYKQQRLIENQYRHTMRRIPGMPQREDMETEGYKHLYFRNITAPSEGAKRSIVEKRWIPNK